MMWLLYGIALYLSVKSTRFRQSLSLAAGIATIWIMVVVGLVLSTDQGSTRHEDAGHLGIPRASVEFVDLQIGTNPPVAILIGGTRTDDFNAPLTYFELRLLVQACPSPEHCNTVVDTTESIFVDVPPQ